MCSMTLPSHPPGFYYPNNIQLVVQVMKVFTMQSPHIPCYLTPLRPQYVLSTLFSYTLNLWPIA